VVLDLSGKRVLLVGAETELGRAVAASVAEAGARVALIGATNDSETAFEVKRLARKVGAEVSQAMDATNEMAVRVMVRQVSKALGGFEAVVFCPVLGSKTTAALDLLHRFAGKELRRNNRRLFAAVVPDQVMDRVTELLLSGPPPGIKQDFCLLGINKEATSADSIVRDVVREVARIPDSR
jgi:NAD(P)-dependent dehydrogenase (short-subunit alcohol dehydrogenase family)